MVIEHGKQMNPTLQRSEWIHGLLRVVTLNKAVKTIYIMPPISN